MAHDEHDENQGLVAVGGELSTRTLLLAYQNGIFPWPISDEEPLLWFSPDPRAILEFERLEIPKSLEKARLKHSQWHLTLDQAFDQVIEACSQIPRAGQEGTWITPKMVEAYREFHRQGHAHSVEVWDSSAQSRLIGGLYGVEVEGVFAGESMFHLEPDASKMALLHLIEHLRSRGAEWIDIQQLTPHMERLGARAISREDFAQLLRQTQARFRSRKLRLFP